MVPPPIVFSAPSPWLVVGSKHTLGDALSPVLWETVSTGLPRSWGNTSDDLWPKIQSHHLTRTKTHTDTPRHSYATHLSARCLAQPASLLCPNTLFQSKSLLYVLSPTTRIMRTQAHIQEEILVMAWQQHVWLKSGWLVGDYFSFSAPLVWSSPMHFCQGVCISANSRYPLDIRSLPSL